MRILGSLSVVLMTLGCGPSPGEETTSGTDTDGPSSDSTTAAMPTTGEPPDPSICLEPAIDGIPVADAALACVDPDGGWGSFDFDFGQWPALGLPDDDYCSDTTVDVIVACVVQAISVAGDASSVELRCQDEVGTHTMTIEIDAPWLRFRVCQGDALALHYYRNNYGCGWGGYAEALVLRDAADRLVAASFGGIHMDWLAPLTVDELPSAGCGFVPNPCGGTERSAMALAVGDAPPVHVYDGTRRIIETPARYVAQVELMWVDESNTCGEGGVPPDLDLALVDP